MINVNRIYNYEFPREESTRKLFMDFLKRRDFPRARYYNHEIYQQVFNLYCSETDKALKVRLAEELEELSKFGEQLIDAQLNAGGTA